MMTVTGNDKLEVTSRWNGSGKIETTGNASITGLNGLRNGDIKTGGFFGSEAMQKLKSIAGHVGLLITLMLYTAIGGMVFRELELPAELARLGRLRSTVQHQRRHLVGAITNNTDVSNLATLVSMKLQDYEAAVQEAAQAGLLVSLAGEIADWKYQDESIEPPEITTERWNILHAVFFASTVLTTIGYGNVVPTTSWGRIFCILFALIGIPLTLTVIADWGKLFAEGVSEIGLRIREKLPAAVTSCIPTNLAGRRSLGAFSAVVLLFLYLACGAGMFMLWEEDWDFFEGFYFCFVTMTTIGFGDLVPKKPKYMLLCTLYILVGLALTSTIIELVRRQYAHSWRRLQALRGPLAETLKRLGEHAGGDMSALQADLRKVLTVVSMPKLRRGGDGGPGSVKDREWEEAVEAVLRDIAAAAPPPPKKPIMQIVIYESSV
ncbi:TWiK family of potassium channels protein 7 [Orussus abietinus]|uniref:TWiK family of potassium channels protein 7 n=1 Tax=Orussus abietinus TaxID=222816 RepID=UPI0006269725|nr:TWiK family of potassium channels protein 7 [Orussus abietinus]XP_012279670.1 TWiK family of potassium channels protein 7 [Orussus abietinus]XP_012279672.1 TWiK family of potassium channels protein 7 [Orussus abietinus]